MKILWTANGPLVPTGYGNQTALWLPRIAASRHEVVLFALGGHDGAASVLPDGTRTLPRIAHPDGCDVVREHFKHERADVVITLSNPCAFDREYSAIPWCAWAPIDCAPPLAADLDAMRRARWVWAMSKFGEAQCRRAGLQHVTYVPHGVDSRVFTDADADGRIFYRREFAARIGCVIGRDTHFVVMVARNNSTPSRKGFREAFAAWRVYCDRHPDSLLYVHSNVSTFLGGEDLTALARDAGIIERVVFADQYRLLVGDFTQSYLRDAYCAADVFLSASHGEGFGIPALEAQMCGCPVILADNTSQIELCMTGWLTECTAYYRPGGPVRWGSPEASTSEWYRPSVSAIVDALEWSWQRRGDEDQRAQARRLALEYDADAVFAKYMLPAIDAMASEVE